MSIFAKLLIVCGGLVVMSFLLATMYVIAITPADDLWQMTCWLTKRAADVLIVRPFRWLVAQFARR